MSISVNAVLMEPSAAFLYLGNTVAYNNSDWLSLYKNISMSRRQCGVLAKVVTNTGAMVRVRGVLYKAVVRTVLIYWW